MNIFKDAGHLFRLAAAFVVGIVLFVVVRGLMVPRSFGEYGHYRGNAIEEIKTQPVSFAGRQACQDCHSDIVELKSKGKHARLGCETCHGPLAAHVEDPASVTPQKPDTGVICAGCHEANGAKPRNFPQVASADHSGGLDCKTCHQPHSPAIEAGGKK